MTAHAFLPPSGAAAWSRCSLWPSLNRKFPQHDNPSSLEGTAAHWVVSEMLADRVCKEGNTSPNGVMITGEMLDGAELVCDTVEQRMKGLSLHIEETLSISQLNPECFGTPDIWARTGVSKHIEIIDYKFGHAYVDEYFNLQGLCYLLGILGKESVASDAAISVSFTVVQPRCYYRGAPVRTHTFTLEDAMPRFQCLFDAAKLATIATPVATTGQQCSQCPGRHVCSALQKAAYRDAECATDRQPHDLTPQAAALELRMLDRALGRLQARVDGLRELTLANIKGGAAIPYYRAEASKGRMQWTVSPDEIIRMGQMFGKDLSNMGIVTPLQAKKLGIDGSVITAYSQITPGSIKLVDENNSNAARVFGK